MINNVQHLGCGSGNAEGMPTRETSWKLEYILNVLWPQQELRVKLQELNGDTRNVIVKAKVRELGPLRDSMAHGILSPDLYERIREMDNWEQEPRVRYADLGSQLLIVKLPIFVLSPTGVADMIRSMKKHDSVVLDLRGNPGGGVETLKDLLGGIFETDVTIGDHVGRNSTKPLQAGSRHNGFRGKLIVLIDSESSSGSELLARIVQIERRGSVLGDRSSGRVMEAQHYSYRVGMGTVVSYGASITEADIKRTDGQSLEHKGVNPDVVKLPTESDLAEGRDPVLAQAAEMLGVKISAEEAEKLFPYEWPKD